MPMPPSIVRVEPVTYGFVIRNAMAWAISSGWAMRRSGMRFDNAAIVSSRASPVIRSSSGVSTMPGRMTLTRMGASSSAIASANTSAPAHRP